MRPFGIGRPLPEGGCSRGAHACSRRVPLPGSLALVLVASLFVVSLCTAAEIPAISNVSVSRPFFNPSLGQRVQITFTLPDSAKLSVLVLDRDGFPVRRLAYDKVTAKGKVSLDWDGRDDTDEVVPDEAYSLKVDVAHDPEATPYFPADVVARELPPGPAIYDRLSGTVSYKLPAPARVHIQAGSAQIDKKTGNARGPVLKTIANREPRTGGPVIETWNGWDDSGTIRVCDLPYFAIGVAATALPENSIITVGNREATFFDWVQKRPGHSLLTASAADHTHHRGLQSMEDVAPKLALEPRNATWSSADRLWLTSENMMEVVASVEGPTAAAFLSHPGKLMVFLDVKSVQTLSAGNGSPSISVPIVSLSSGPHRLTVNWVSDYGPVAVSSVLFRVEKTGTARTASK